MWSIYNHTMFRSGLRASVLPLRLQLMPLTEAIELLLGCFDEHDATRRRRAVAKLVAAGLHDENHLLRVTDPDTAKILRTQVRSLVDSVGVDPARIAGLSLSDAPLAVLRLMSDAALAAGECAVRNPSCVACLDGMTLQTTVTAVVEVNRPLDELRRVLDPRNWDECSDAFVDTHPVKLEPNYPPATIAAPPGDPWCGHLWEEVDTGIAKFVNVLKVEFHVGDNIEVEFQLYDPVSAEILGIPRGGALLVDQGSVTATSISTGWSEIRVVKTVQFVDLTPGDPGNQYDVGELLNYLAPGILCLWHEDETQMGPCCDPGASPGP
jgi:hypothetical protein